MSLNLDTLEPGAPPPRRGWARVRVKICGLTCPEDALAAARAGVDAVGLNFALGPRKITPETGKAIVDALPRFVTPIGLFVDAAPETVREIAAHCGFGVVQLHGDESPEDAERLAPLRVIKAFCVTGPEVVERVAAYRVHAVLLDAAVPGRHGGTGRTFDWALARRLARRLPIMLAGGLTPANVADAVRRVRPWAVDSASGVEEGTPGRKSPERMHAFVAAAADAFREHVLTPPP
jgi:phosphoribosylanthranilate isomerase